VPSPCPDQVKPPSAKKVKKAAAKKKASKKATFKRRSFKVKKEKEDSPITPNASESSGEEDSPEAVPQVGSIPRICIC